MDNKSNILYGKKLVVCGDSFCEGDFSGYVDENGLSGTDSPVIYDKKRGMYKTFPWWIAERNDMELINESKCGSVIALDRDYIKDPNAEDLIFRFPFSLERYKKVPLDADYILLQFGLNDMFNCDLGSIDDTTNKTFYGAFNIVLEYFITNAPYAKVCTVVSNAYLSEDFRVAIIEVSKKWGIPCLDLLGDTKISSTLSKRGMCKKAEEIRNKQFFVTEDNGHPNLKAHELISTVYENFLRGI